MFGTINSTTSLREYKTPQKARNNSPPRIHTGLSPNQKNRGLNKQAVHGNQYDGKVYDQDL